jgi:hypothetical protein
VHVAVTAHPTAAWTAQQLREAFSWDQAPLHLLRDRDHAFDGWMETAKTMGIDELLTAPRSPWQNAYVERFIGSARRECPDHVIVFSATGLRRLMKLYCTYYGQPAPICRSTRTRRFPARSRQPAQAASWRSRRSAASITDTSAPPDPASPTRTRGSGMQARRSTYHRARILKHSVRLGHRPADIHRAQPLQGASGSSAPTLILRTGIISSPQRI